jgi:glycosyltransferase involved in cell wall biosynthesis
MEDKKTAVIVAWRDTWHPKRGGAEDYITKVAEALRDASYKVIFFTEKYKDSKDQEIIDGIQYVRKGNSVTMHLHFPLYFKKHLKDNCDILVENFNAVPFGVPRLHNRTLTIIHHVQSPEWKKLLGNLVGGLVAKYFTNRLISTYRDKPVVCVSPSTKDELLDLGFNSDKMEIIYNGIEVQVTDQIQKSKDKINILSLGRVRATKHINEAIEMVKYSLDKGVSNIHLDIAGKGDDEERLKSMVKNYNIENFVKFWGYVSDEQKIELLDKAHIHVQFSRKEGWGITVIEAAARATPTICYRVPGLIDSVKDETGYFIDTNLKDTWDKVISDISQNSEDYIGKQKKGIEWAKNFKWDSQMDKFVKYIQRLE